MREEVKGDVAVMGVGVVMAAIITDGFIPSKGVY